MERSDVSRRTVLKGGGAALAALSVLRISGPAHAFPGHAGEQDESLWDGDERNAGPTLGRPGDQVIPWLDQPPPAPIPPEFAGNQLKWEELESWLIPAHNFHYVTHYGIPVDLVL